MAKKERAAAKAKRAAEVALPAAGAGPASAPNVYKSWLQRHRSIACAVGTLAALLWAWLDAAAKPRRLRVLAVERMELGEMGVERFLRDYAAQKPVVLTGAWREDRWRPEEVVAACPKAEIRTFRHEERSEAWARQVQVGVSSLQAYFGEYFEAPVAERPEPLLYGFEMELKAQCPQQLEHVQLPAFLTEDAFHLVTNRAGLGWPSVLFGPEGSQTGLHIDTHILPFWIAVVATEDGGTSPLKRFRIFPHNDSKLLKHGKATASVNFLFDFDPWRPDYRAHPDLADGHVFETELRSGDLLYIPGGSPHAVKNLADNLGVSMNFLDLKSMPEFARRCNAKSPLCGLLAGKGAWVLDALEQRRQLGKAMSYWEFAGIADRQDFCAVHAAANATQPRPALDEYCGWAAPAGGL